MAKTAKHRKAISKRTRNALSKAVVKARRFQKRAFAGRTFSVNSATLIAQARRERAGK